MSKPTVRAGKTRGMGEGGKGEEEGKATSGVGVETEAGRRQHQDAADGGDRERQRNDFLEARRRLKEEKRRASLKIRLQNNTTPNKEDWKPTKKPPKQVYSSTETYNETETIRDGRI